MPGTIDDSLGVQNYGTYQNTVSYDYVSGLLFLPCADGSPVTSRVHAPFSIKSQSAGGNKLGTPPVLPKESSTDILLTKTVSLPLPTPVQSAGGSTWNYAAATTIQTLEAEPSTVETSFSYGKWPFRLDPMDKIAETASVGSPPSINLNDGTGEWKQQLVVTSDFFATQM